MKHERVLLAGMLLAASFCGGALATLLLGGQVEAQGPRAVTTPQVNLVDAAGTLRGVLSASDGARRRIAGAARRGGPGPRRVPRRVERGRRRSSC